MYYIEILAYCSVDLFALISGYFGIMSKKHSSKKFVELIFTYVFYFVIIGVIVVALFHDKFNAKTLIWSLIPGIGPSWYLVCYLPICLFRPFVNEAINKFSNSQLKFICIFMAIFFSFFPSLFHLDLMGTSNGYSFIWLLSCYIFGAFIKKNEGNEKLRNYQWLAIFICCSLVLLFGNIFVFHVFNKEIDYFVSYTSPITLLMAVCIFMICKNANFKGNSSILKWLSIFSFDVYLIHGNTILFNGPWKDSFHWIVNLSLPMIPLVIIGFAILVALICYAIAFAGDKLYGRFHFERMINRIDSRLFYIQQH